MFYLPIILSQMDYSYVKIFFVSQVLPPDIREFLHEALHLPKSSNELNFSIGDANIKFLNAPTTKKLNLDEEIALMNCF